MSNSKFLREKVRKELIPFLAGKGFKLHGRELNFVRLRRYRDGKLQFIDIQFDKYSRPRFVLNLGEMLDKDLTITGNDTSLVIKRSQLDTSHAEIRAHMGGLGWFRVKPLTKILLGENKSARRLITKVEHSYPEIEKWFLTKEAGKQITNLKLPDPPGLTRSQE